MKKELIAYNVGTFKKEKEYQVATILVAVATLAILFVVLHV